MKLTLGGKPFVFDRTKIMGILNLTDDSFYSGSRISSQQILCERVAEMISEGVDVIDIGAASSRPGAKPVPVAIEKDKISEAIPLIQEVIGDKSVFISIDTFNSQVAEIAIKKGAHLINDISAGEMDQKMLPLIAETQIAYSAMHMRGNPENMVNQTVYEHVTTDVINYFTRLKNRFEKLGINNLLFDPGIGFAKTIDQNFQLLNEINRFNTLNVPLLVGVSRKSLIQKTIGVNSEFAANGSTVLHTYLVQKGIQMIRTHDVRELQQTIQLLKRITDSPK
ncbi:MAG: dihydropteroate synthase [Bacteroidetes bacterium]|nr:dihydropteroate synthase [Bacteroidota bacterium]